MYRIRFHGRGGQGMKTASRILGTAFFLAGFEVQDAPRYGAERRGAPLFAYVRAARQPINERGIIRQPDLVIVADDTLVAVPAAGVLAGISERTVFLIASFESPETWRNRLNFRGLLLTLPPPEDIEDRAELPYVSAACAGAAARLIGVITPTELEQAIREELADAGPAAVQRNLDKALEVYTRLAEYTGTVREGESVPAQTWSPPAWVELPLENVEIAAPHIHATLTSVQVKTGLWRTLRPIIDYERCNHCWWVCSTFCPDGAIAVDARIILGEN